MSSSDRNNQNLELDIIPEEENQNGLFVIPTDDEEQLLGGIPVSDFELPPRSLYQDVEEDNISDAGCVAPDDEDDDDDDQSSMPDFSMAGLVSALGTEGVEDYMMTPAIMPPRKMKSSSPPYRTSEALSFAESTDLIPPPAAAGGADMPDTPERVGRDLAIVPMIAAAASSTSPATSPPAASSSPIKSPTLTTTDVLNVLNAREASERARCRLLVIAAALTGLLVIGIALGAVFGMKPATAEPAPRWAKDDASSENPPPVAMKTRIPMPTTEAPVSPVTSPTSPTAEESPILPVEPTLAPTFVPVFPTQSPHIVLTESPTFLPTGFPTTKPPTTKPPTTKRPTHTKRPTTKRPTTKRPTTKAPTTMSPTDSPVPSPSPSRSPSLSLLPTDTQVPSGRPSLRPSRSKAPSVSIHPTKSPAPSPLPSFVPTKTETPTSNKEQKNGKRER